MNKLLPWTEPRPYEFRHSLTEQATEDYELHCHAFYEAYYFIRGDVTYMIEGTYYALQPYTLLLIVPGTFHGMKINSSKPYERYVLHFFQELIPEDERAYLLPAFDKSGCYENAKLLMSDYLFLDQLEALSPELTDRSMPHRLLALMYAVRQCCDVSRKESKMSWVQGIVDYIDENLAGTLSPEQIAKHFFISRSCLESRFKKYTGSTLAYYIRRKRLAKAQHYISLGVSKGEAVLLAGFSDYSTFYRALRRDSV